MKKIEVMSIVIGGTQILGGLVLAVAGIMKEKQKRNGKEYKGMFSGRNINDIEA